ncbi:MAG: hypothetical protein NC221_01765 [Duncaniella sp.]|nr:hypothetical protein [Muribaculum sp.]MCM1254830.1 hypothetical protein [Duncaniella sp.]
MKRYLMNMFQLILSPGNGWEDIQGANENSRDIFRNGYIPLIAITAASVFVQGIYHHHEFLVMFLRMLITFLVYFISYFFGTFILSVFVESTIKGAYNERKCETFTLYTLGLLALISLVINCLPITPMMLFFLPFYVALVQWKATMYMDVKPQRAGIFMIIAILGVLLPVYILFFLFSSFLTNIVINT